MKTPSFLEENDNFLELDDIYNRKIVIDNICNFIKNNNTNQGVKLGLYGSWGSGKTTILKHIEDKINETNDNKPLKSFRFYLKPYSCKLLTSKKVIFLDIRNVDSANKVLSYFIEDIIMSLGFVKSGFYFISKYFIIPFIIIFIGYLYVNNLFTNLEIFKDISLESIYKNKGTWLGVLFPIILPLIIKLLLNFSILQGYSNGFDKVFVGMYLVFKAKLGERVLIIVDDLDRIRPDFLTDILLWLNKISSIKKGLVDIIISADPIKLSEGVKVSNKQYNGNEGYQFLEKIIDTPYYIDELNKESKYIFWNQYKEELIKDFEGFKQIEGFIDFLPNNIRQIKRYFRFLYTYVDEIKRYEDNEINIQLLFFISLFKLEHPNECLSFIKNDIPKIKYGIMFTKEDDEKLINFKKELDSDIKRKYLDFLIGKWISINDLSKYYYFYDNIDKITKKEFYESFLKGDSKFSDLKIIFESNYIQLLNLLSNHKEIFYGKLIGENLSVDMKKNEKYVKKIYKFMTETVDLIENNISIDKESFKNILRNIISYNNFTYKINDINFNSHRKKDKQLFNNFIEKINPEILLSFKYEVEKIEGKVDGIYWLYLLENINKESYDYDLVEDRKKKLIFKQIKEFKGLNNLKDIKYNDFLNQNLVYILYGLLEEMLRNHDEKNIKILKSKKFKDIFKQIAFSKINYRALGSFKQEVLNRLPSDYKKHLKYIIDEVDKCTIV